MAKFTTINEVFLQHRVHNQSETRKSKTISLQQREQHRMEQQNYSMKLSNISLTEEEMLTINQYTANIKCKMQLKRGTKKILFGTKNSSRSGKER